ncbi:hypothetical protein C8F01DRAFT_1077789 [Mycena amicta]|nr:hypothetical protein C8F01DRAFT_1077789 [Mycena amicta]
MYSGRCTSASSIPATRPSQHLQRLAAPPAAAFKAYHAKPPQLGSRLSADTRDAPGLFVNGPSSMVAFIARCQWRWGRRCWRNVSCDDRLVSQSGGGRGCGHGICKLGQDEGRGQRSGVDKGQAEGGRVLFTFRPYMMRRPLDLLNRDDAMPSIRVCTAKVENGLGLGLGRRLEALRQREARRARWAASVEAKSLCQRPRNQTNK